jgi:hypothetical protein
MVTGLISTIAGSGLFMDFITFRKELTCLDRQADKFLTTVITFCRTGISTVPAAIILTLECKHKIITEIL